MTAPAIETIASQDAATNEALIALNNANAVETSFLTSNQWQSMIQGAFSATCMREPAALLITFDQDADYDSVNFQWFRERLDRFVYIDRIVVSENHRDAGLARILYDQLFTLARAAGHHTVTCEVKAEPPNFGFDAFHARMGFEEMGLAALVDRSKTVRYFTKPLL
jgi:predicted GNAT superfamily acetyltransferase